jgi:DNA-nicking Smr family endonuclease
MTNRADEPRRPAPDERLWQDAVRGVRPLRGRRLAAPAALPPLPAESGKPERQQAPARGGFAGIDRATAERLKRGLRPVEARLDLHGMTQPQAHRVLAEFIRTSFAAGRRCLLVITGCGLGAGGPGILKSAVPRWLDEGELRRRILAVMPAQPLHGGAGALYVLLRRQR